LKPRGATASFEDRVAMTRLAIADEPAFALSLADAPKPTGAPNFSLETLRGLRAELPADGSLFCLMGADSFHSLRRWRQSAEIPFVASLIVASRPGLRAARLVALQALLPEGLTLEALPSPTEFGSGGAMRTYRLRNAVGETAPLYLLPGLHIEISASEIRSRLRQPLGSALSDGAEEPQLVCRAVSGYIRSHRLYL
jgi:nicotinate-nucleotide adenylyltransferase